MNISCGISRFEPRPYEDMHIFRTTVCYPEQVLRINLQVFGGLVVITAEPCSRKPRLDVQPSINSLAVACIDLSLPLVALEQTRLPRRFATVIMPNSMDISAYEKVPFLENLEDGTTSTTSTTSRSDEGDTSVAVLSRSMLSRPSPHVNVVRSPWMFLLDLGLVILVLIFAVRKSHVNGVQLQGDVTGFVPQFDHEITTFRAHPEFVSNHTSIESLQIAQKAWTEFLPRKLSPK